MTDNRCIIGLDIGGSSVKVGLVGVGYSIIERALAPTYLDDPCRTITECASVAKQLIERSNTQPIAVGVACPGPIEIGGRKLMKLPNLPGWADFEIADCTERSFDLPAVVENDANAAALAEAVVGAAKGSALMLMVTLGTGVGGGIVAGGKLIRGAGGAAGEFGHITIEPSGRMCGCGKRGCLETFIGSSKLLERYIALGGRPDADTSVVVTESRENREPGLTVIREAGARLGGVLGDLCNALDPDVIVIGGGVSMSGEALFNSIGHSLADATMPQLRGRCSVRHAALGNDAGFIGAAIAADECGALHN